MKDKKKNDLPKRGIEMKRNILVYIKNTQTQKDFRAAAESLESAADFRYCKNLSELRKCVRYPYDCILLGQPTDIGGCENRVLGGIPDLSAAAMVNMVRQAFGMDFVELSNEIVDEICDRVDEGLENGVSYSDEELMARISKVASEYPGLSMESVKYAAEKVYNIMRRDDILTNILKDDKITEIMVNGDDNIFIERQGYLIRTHYSFHSKTRLKNYISRIVSSAGRQIDESNPIVDARLEDGSRINAVLEPVALNGPILTIRRFPSEPLKMSDMIQNDTLDTEAAEFIEKLVKAKYNIFISGGTGTGKTTMLNILTDFIPRDERIITIEDSAELQINHIPNIVRLETRNANTNRKGEISISDLIKTSLRMRPDRIIVGEVRREEAIDMLQAMNTGHDGSISTGHANSAYDMMSRLETMVCTANANMPVSAVRSQIASAIDVVIHLQRMRDHSRKVVEISEVRGVDENGEIRLVPLYRFSESDDSTADTLKGKIEKTDATLQNTLKLQLAGLM